MDHLLEASAGILLIVRYEARAGHGDHGLAQGRDAIRIKGITGGSRNGPMELEVGLH
ncbi:hypothetical protein D3C73_1619950 [compost metagenome]